MAHQTLKSGYHALIDRINQSPQGAPPSDLLFQILKVLVGDNEAQLIALLPIRPFKAHRAATIWKMADADAQKILDELASRAVLLDFEHHGVMHYILPPPMAGFFEFSMMRVRSDVDQKLLAELLHQYLNVEEDFIRELFGKGDTQMGRVFVQEPALPKDDTLHVLDYERASEVIKNASDIGIGLCYCRHKMSHLDRACDAPMDICMTFNSAASSLNRHGITRHVEMAECMDKLDEAYCRGLVQFGENAQRKISFICNCCGCCCEALLAARRIGHLRPVHTTNYIPAVNAETCTGCGTCINSCPVEAMSLVSANDPHHPKKRRAKLDTVICLGCGVCIRSCPTTSLTLRRREQSVITPVDSIHRIVIMAIERGKLQNLIFDSQVSFGHRAMRAILGSILRLPLIKQTLAQKQMNSRYIEKLLASKSV